MNGLVNSDLDVIHHLDREMVKDSDVIPVVFGKDGGVRMAEKYGVPLLGQIPIVQSIRENGDAGEPAALSSRPDGLAFLDLAEKLVKAVNMP